MLVFVGVVLLSVGTSKGQVPPSTTRATQAIGSDAASKSEVADLSRQIDALAQKLESQASDASIAPAWIAAISGVIGIIVTSLVTHRIHKENIRTLLAQHDSEREAKTKQLAIEEGRFIFDLMSLSPDRRQWWAERKLREFIPDLPLQKATDMAGAPHHVAQLIRLGNESFADQLPEFEQLAQGLRSQLIQFNNWPVVSVMEGDAVLRTGVVIAGYVISVGAGRTGDYRVIERSDPLHWSGEIVATDDATSLTMFDAYIATARFAVTSDAVPDIGTLVYVPSGSKKMAFAVTSISGLDDRYLHLTDCETEWRQGTPIWGPRGLVGLYAGNNRAIRIEYICQFIEAEGHRSPRPGQSYVRRVE